jgi:Putative metallopeptidase
MLNYFKWMSSLALVSLFTVGNVPKLFPQAAAQAKTPVTTATAKQIPTNLVARYRRSGRINVVYGKTNDPLSAALIKGYQQYGLFEEIGDLITSEIDIPQDITVALIDCGQANAAYLSDKHAIVVCNELTQESYQLLLKNGHSQEEALRKAILASVFFFYHEAGHMLIHELNLPTTGREEDAVDQFSAFFLLSNDSSETKSVSGEIILSAAQVFALESTEPGIHEYQDEHGLSQQRAYGLVCMLYGANPEQYSDLVRKLDYSESRLQRCQTDAPTIVSAWQRLLQPYLKS